MVSKIVFNYEPGYHSSFISLDEINLTFTSTYISYEELYFDDFTLPDNHLAKWTKKISILDFNKLVSLVDRVEIDNETALNYYDSDVTRITIINDDGSKAIKEIYCSFTKNNLTELQKNIEYLIGSEYLFPSMR